MANHQTKVEQINLIKMKNIMYQCMFTAVGCAYSSNYYDLPTDDEKEIKITTLIKKVYQIKHKHLL